MSSLIPAKVLFTVVAEGFSVKVARGPGAWLTLLKDGKEHCTILVGCDVSSIIHLL